ncbi:ATP-dependent protease ATPase subunit HslU [Candidatus Sumerlaeota bacterium]|nr:ATP-dependent protease ATPase subunit HslU [Candidatus Sumerlaeota bacterium]
MSDDKGLTPKEIVTELDKYIIGQNEAKKMVAIALRNRARRKELPPELRDEVSPKNIIMIGPTGVGKTEIARRLARLANAPFVKVEATKYTEVGYVGRDVESMVRELCDVAVNMVREEKTKEIMPKAQQRAKERILDLLLPAPPSVKHKQRTTHATAVAERKGEVIDVYAPPEDDEARNAVERWQRNRKRLEDMLDKGLLDDREIEIEVTSPGGHMIAGFSIGSGIEEMGIDMKSFLDRIIPPQKTRKKITVKEAKRILVDEEVEKLIDMDKIVKEALQRVQETGIIFIDEIDKIAGRGRTGYGPDVSREGVQRDILPIVEGSTVFTKYGMVRTDHILFIAAGAFHQTKPSDLIPELQGRFPLRVELHSLDTEDFKRILTEPQNALTKQYQALLATEGVTIEFTEDGIEEIAVSAKKVNEQSENIGARRLYTIMEKVFEEVSFEAPTLKKKKIVVDAKFVRDRLKDILKSEDLSKFIL